MERDDARSSVIEADESEVEFRRREHPLAARLWAIAAPMPDMVSQQVRIRYGRKRPDSPRDAPVIIASLPSSGRGEMPPMRFVEDVRGAFGRPDMVVVSIGG